MISDTKGAARSSDETYPWHCICVLRVGSVLWVYDPAFDPAPMPLKGLIMAKALWIWLGKHGITIRDMRITGAGDMKNDVSLCPARAWRIVRNGESSPNDELQISTSARDEIERVLHPHIWARGDGSFLPPSGNDLGARHLDRPTPRARRWALPTTLR